jgi:hypothetical protein
LEQPSEIGMEITCSDLPVNKLYSWLPADLDAEHVIFLPDD